MYKKIATCCYCGTRAALSLKGKERHELACSTCGAPLHEMKMLRTDVVERSRAPRPMPPQSFHAPRPEKARTSRRNKRVKKGRSLAQRFMSEVWDEVEDFFDDIFD